MMGLLGGQQNGNAAENGIAGSEFQLGGSKNKYQRMESEVGETAEDVPLTDKNSRRYVLACAIFASLNSVLLGYDVGVMSGAIIFIQEDLKLTNVQLELLVGILSIVSLLGSLAGGKTSDVIGRKWTIALASIVFQSGALIMALAPNFTVLMIGRLFAGVGIGFGVMIAPVYIAEISSATARGSLTSLPEIFVNFGILLGYISNYVFSGLPAHISWRVMLGVGLIPSIFLGFSLFVIPESPRWLVMQNRMEDARMVLIKTNESEKDVADRLAEIQQAAGMANDENYEAKAIWREIVNPNPAVRRMLITGCGIQCFQQITGIDALVYYSPTIFKDAGIKGNTEVLAATVVVGFTKTVFILVAIFLIDRVGRKPLLYVGTIGMTACLFVLSVALALPGQGEVGIGVAILAVCGNVAFFSVGIGPICWVLSSEVFPLKLRAQASALGAVGSRVSSGVITMSFLSVSGAITVAGTFFIFSLISGLSVAFVHTCVPETKGKTLEEIEMLFQDKGEWQGGGEVEMGDAERLVENKLPTIEPVTSLEPYRQVARYIN
ncbi:hypothetical protein ACFX13_037581 [Malus domestica]|uniref:Major facilitator superfamily (MFS) profile domain-containing protein n=1 Tax=Malus domestica TaxID=3750 RepID=A0A498JVV9_MALDO|nr:probable polyol transporter 4 [Malus domestica]XP_050148171.1 probable polyol transporter 4 [Malus sylvestris]RXH99226.1 hypothetical protein DVH24_011551 [Malus domestica]